MTPSMLAVHGGVGFSLGEDSAKWCADALTSTEAEDIAQAVSFLEDHKYFNCGVGSNLTAQGTVECEAGYMTSLYHRFGAIGCVSNIKNPVSVAKAIAQEPAIPGLVKPQVIVGKGAETWAFEKGFVPCEPEDLITSGARKEWHKAIENMSLKTGITFDRFDTVGGVALKDGHAEACVSSGGVLLKRPGRLGHSTHIGAGSWADKYGDCLIAVSASGCGEALVRTDFCRSLARAIMHRNSHDLPAQTIEQWFQTDFLRSPYISDMSKELIYAGGIVMLQERGCAELLVFHNTPAFPVAYKTRGKTKRIVSTLQRGAVKCDSFLL